MRTKSQDIRNQDEVPSTHFFVYQNSKYPFNFDFFKIFSKYISENQHELEHNKEIKLLNDKAENSLSLSKETIESFIKYVQRETITINDDNALELNYLATIYKVNSLIKHTDEYIVNHQEDLILDLFSISLTEPNSISTSKYEDIISEQLLKYIDDERLLDFGIPILHRILTKYAFKKSNKLTKSFETFLFKCLDKYGKKASILFNVFVNDQLATETLKTLYSKYHDVFDFQFINPQIFKQIYEEQEKVIGELKDEINRLKYDMKNKEDQNNEIMNKLPEYEERIKQLNEENGKKDIKIQKQEAEINDLKNEILRLKDEIMSLTEIKTFDYKQGHEFEGIITNLVVENEGNIHDKGIIEVTTNNLVPGYAPQNLVGMTPRCYYANQGSTDFWICFDFKKMEIEISHYSIKSYGNNTQGHLRNWVVEVSNDNIKWDKIDEHNNCSDLKGNTIIKTNKVKPNHFSRYCKIHHKGEFWGYSKIHHPGIQGIEFYGKLKK